MVVLIVDDEPDIAQALSLLLRDQGITVFTALNGKEGLDVAGRVKPDVILVDLMMPVMDGLSFLDRISDVSSAVVVVMTGSKAPHPKYAVQFVRKPFDPDRLIDIVLAAGGKNPIKVSES